MGAGIVIRILVAVAGPGVVVSVLVAGAGLTALMLGAGIVVSVIVAGAGLTTLVLGAGVVVAGVRAGLAVAIVFAGAGCLAVSAVSAGCFVVGAWLVIAVAITKGWLDPGPVAAVALGRNSRQYSCCC